MLYFALPISLLLQVTFGAIVPVLPSHVNARTVVAKGDRLDVAGVCIQNFKISDDIKAHQTPPWLESWDDLEADGPCDSLPVTVVDASITSDLAAKIVAYNLASGVYRVYWDLKYSTSDTKAKELDTFWETGRIGDVSVDEKRKRWYISSALKWINP